MCELFTFQAETRGTCCLTCVDVYISIALPLKTSILSEARPRHQRRLSRQMKRLRGGAFVCGNAKGWFIDFFKLSRRQTMALWNTACRGKRWFQITVTARLKPYLVGSRTNRTSKIKMEHFNEEKHMSKSPKQFVFDDDFIYSVSFSLWDCCWW